MHLEDKTKEELIKIIHKLEESILGFYKPRSDGLRKIVGTHIHRKGRVDYPEEISKTIENFLNEHRFDKKED